MADDNEPRTLKQIAALAAQKRQAIEATSPVSNPSYAADLEIAIQAHRDTIETISRVSLFSPNEPLDDIATPDLPYLLTESFLADLYLKTPTPNPIDRELVLSEAREAYERFLASLDSYEILTPAHKTLYSRYTDDPAAFSTVAASDPSKRRGAKIANFRAEKDLKARLATLAANPRYGLNRELEVLAQAATARPLLPARETVEEDARRRRAAEESGHAERLEPRRLRSILEQSGPLLSKAGKPMRPFTLVGSREEAQAGVFRTGHNLPTMSIDEYLEEERKRGGIIEGGGEASFHRPEPDEDDYEKADEATYKARAWDEFVEANPKGAGNTLNRG
ncbi:TapA protein [Verticillium alfalfae VaMs.102]|uniref:TapA protein n=1 Tax=Verticillium alfalfae (strain VaMs.102 / ATCC MYA-4576 / FGSC 10136) TaxID=526221 RepID=C9S7J3_VERA1|nr:TapA protein [Verticillium alfalfae VaMs.102]EEY14754.1 TapA protein [Verticillium alfalfae VaMs.102]